MTQRLAVLMAVYNRREQTLRCLRALEKAAAQLAAGWEWRVFMTDDGSDDGTGDAVIEAFGANVEVIRADGALFWAASMAAAEAAATAWAPDAYLWLNDDVELQGDGLETLVESSASLPSPSIVCGPVLDRASGAVSYAGFRTLHWNPVKLTEINPAGFMQPIDTFTGNAVFVPRAAAATIGTIDGGFAHAYADIDYGMRAKAADVGVFLAAQSVGYCAANPIRAVIYDSRVPFRRRWAAAMDRRGIPWRSQARLYRRHAGHLWVLLLVASYVRVLVPPRHAPNRNWM